MCGQARDVVTEMEMPCRVAFFPDSFHEVNGVAHTARNFTAYAQCNGLPFLCIRAALAGTRGAPLESTDGFVTTLDLPRSRASIRMEKDLGFDPFFWRYARVIERALRAFKPDVIHITGPSELGILGGYFAWKLGLPLAASWHTNVHEYAARRAGWLSRVIPSAGRWIEAGALLLTTRFYRLAGVLYAPNEELCDLLREKTGRPCHVMRRGVDTDLFTPAKRMRGAEDGSMVLGYVGRLSVEKNIGLLPVLQRTLLAAGVTDVCFLIVGHGDRQAALQQAMPDARFVGVQRGEALAQSYADMDLFVFPSETDTFGNVVLEALASGVPAAVTTGGGPKYTVQDGVTGIVREGARLADAVCELVRDPARLRKMGYAARAYALQCRWDAIFEDVYKGYLDLRRPARPPE